MTQETSTWLYKRRYARNIAAKCLGTLATLFGLFWLIWILWTCLKSVSYTHLTLPTICSV